MAIIKDPDTKPANDTPEYDHRIESDGPEFAQFVQSFPNVTEALSATALIIPSSKDEWFYNNKEGAFHLRPNGSRFDIYQQGVQDAMKTNIDGKKQFLTERAKVDIPLNQTITELGFNWAKAIEDLDWPDPSKIDVLNKFNSKSSKGPAQIRAFNAASGVYLGNDLLLSCGHGTEDIRVGEAYDIIFGWSGDVNTKAFPPYAFAKIVDMIAWDPENDPTKPKPKELNVNDPSYNSLPSYKTPMNYDLTAAEAKKWDLIIFKLQFRETPPPVFTGVKIAPTPASFSDSIYGIGCPEGAQRKISPKSRVLRYKFDYADKNWARKEEILNPPGGRFSTNLEFFGGNSGGPIFNSNTGEVVGVFSGTISSTPDYDADPKDWQKEGNDKMQAMNRIISQAWTKSGTDPDGSKFDYVPHGKLVKQADLRELADGWVVCKNGDRMPNGETKKSSDGPDFAYPVRYNLQSPEIYNQNLASRVDRYGLLIKPIEEVLLLNKLYHITEVSVQAFLIGNNDKTDLKLRSDYNVPNSEVLETHSSLIKDGPIWRSRFGVQGNAVGILDSKAALPGLPLRLVKSPIGPAGWKKFILAGDSGAKLEGRFFIVVKYFRSAFQMNGGTEYPKEEFVFINDATQNGRAFPPPSQELSLRHWRGQLSYDHKNKFPQDEARINAILELS